MLPSDAPLASTAHESDLRGVMGAPDETASAVSWAAVLAGAVVAAGLSLILLALGTGLGFEALSPWSGVGAAASTVGTVAILWLVVTQILASAMGGYLAGRLRTKWTRIHTDEVYFRDTAHGLLVWATSVVATAAFLASAVTTLAGGHAGRTLGSAVGTSAASAADGTSPDVYFVDALFRSDRPSADRTDAAIRSEAGRLLAAGLRDGALPPADQSYLASLISAKTGLGQADAERRAADVFAQLQTAVDHARKGAAHLSLWMFIALLAGAFFASYAATIGGRQRDHVVLV